jgi:hypothetical protein
MPDARRVHGKAGSNGGYRWGWRRVASAAPRLELSEGPGRAPYQLLPSKARQECPRG